MIILKKLIEYSDKAFSKTATHKFCGHLCSVAYPGVRETVTETVKFFSRFKISADFIDFHPDSWKEREN
jgi:hypothetical protein